MSPCSWSRGRGRRGLPAVVRRNCGCYRYPKYGSPGDRRCTPDVTDVRVGGGGFGRAADRERRRVAGYERGRGYVRNKENNRYPTGSRRSVGVRCVSVRSGRGDVPSGERTARPVGRPAQQCSQIGGPIYRRIRRAFRAPSTTSRDSNRPDPLMPTKSVLMSGTRYETLY